MDELQKRGGKLIYDPGVVVHRRPRGNLSAFCKMLMTYGRGRAEQFRLHPTLGSAMNFVPPLFVVYLVTLPLLVRAGFIISWSVHPGAEDAAVLVAWLPVFAYGAVLFIDSFFSAVRKGLLRAICSLPLLFATHLFYGLGFWRGLFSRVEKTKPATTEVTLERIAI